MKISGFITNLGKYNAGELVGKRIEFPIDDDDLEEVLSDIGIGEMYEEYFFTDWECDVDLGLGEYVSIQEVNDLAEKLDEWDDEDLLMAAIELSGIEYVLDSNPDDYYLYGDVSNDYDLGLYYIDKCYCEPIPEWIENYIDYESFGRDARINEGGIYTAYGYIYCV